MSKEQAFSGFSQGFLGAAEAGTEAEAQASRTALKIYCKSFLECFGTLVTAARDFGPRSLSGCSENFDLEDREEPEGVTEGIKEEVTEGHSRQGRPRP